MRFTLILTANGRHDELLRFFRSLRDKQCTSSVNVRFVNQGTFVLPTEIVFPPSIQYSALEIGHPLPLSRARNLVMGELQGEVIAFPDDDCWYHPTLLCEVKHFFDINPDADCLCTCVFDPANNKTYGNRPLGVDTAVDFSNIFKLPSSVGIFVKRDALLKAGACFDETLGAGTDMGSGEEIDLIARLLNSGARIRYSGAIRVYHPVSDFIEQDVRKYQLYGQGFGFLNGRLVARRRYQVLVFCSRTCFRSFVGIIVHFFDPLRRRLYQGRLKGILVGFVRGFREG